MDPKQNRVVLMDYAGGDSSHALSAWQSTNVELGIELPLEVKERVKALFEATQKGKKKERAELLSMLASHGHHTPFENSYIFFQCTGDIASHIHSLKHRIGTSINGESARYKELADKHYVPEDWKGIAPAGGIPSWIKYHFDEYGKEGNEVEDFYGVLAAFNELSEELYHEALRVLTPELGRKRAKESARYFLTYSKQMDYTMVFNFRSFMNFQKLRNEKHAQEEIQKIAQDMLDQVREVQVFEESLKAFGY